MSEQDDKRAEDAASALFQRTVQKMLVTPPERKDDKGRETNEHDSGKRSAD